MTVYAPVSSPAFFVRNNNGNPFTINSTISGSGCLGVKAEGKNGRATFAFGGENSGFTGPLHVGADGNDDYVTLRISSKANIGGNPPARLERGLWVLYRGTLQATETLTLDDPNRMVNFDTCFIKVDAGKTLRKYNVTIGEEEVELDGETRVRFYAMLAPRGLVVVVK